MTTHTITLARHTAQVVGTMGVLVLGTWDSYGTEQLLLRPGPEWEGLAIDATFHNTPSDEGVTMLVDAWPLRRPGSPASVSAFPLRLHLLSWLPILRGSHTF